MEIKYVYELPFPSRNELCMILDHHDDWKHLGGIHMGYNFYQLSRMEKAHQRAQSPTDELLTEWGTQNHTILELYRLLSLMRHHQAMTVLEPFIRDSYRRPNPDEGNGQVRDLPATRLPTPPTQNEAPAQIGETVKQNQSTRKVSDPLMPQGCTPHIPLRQLIEATKNWATVLGSGGFGTVYKGDWKNTTVAVKKLNAKRNKADANLCDSQKQQSERELKYLSSCPHDNILRLFGVCFEADSYCLVYQYMENGSLEDRLLLRQQTEPLSWAQRFTIAKGTARGLQFVHSQVPPLIHGDIKSANILLNSHFEPVIGDFGLTQDGPVENCTHITLVGNISGTKPYLPQEYLASKKLSTKVDVYSYGIVLFEIATGLRALDQRRGGSECLLKNLVTKYIDSHRMMDLVDKNAQPVDRNIVTTLFNVGLKCVESDRRNRPDMIEVYCSLKMCTPGSRADVASTTNQSLRASRPAITPILSGVPNPQRVLSTNPSICPPHKFHKGELGSNHPASMVNPSPFLLQTTSQSNRTKSPLPGSQSGYPMAQPGFPSNGPALPNVGFNFQVQQQLLHQQHQQQQVQMLQQEQLRRHHLALVQQQQQAQLQEQQQQFLPYQAQGQQQLQQYQTQGQQHLQLQGQQQLEYQHPQGQQLQQNQLQGQQQLQRNQLQGQQQLQRNQPQVQPAQHQNEVQPEQKQQCEKNQIADQQPQAPQEQQQTTKKYSIPNDTQALSVITEMSSCHHSTVDTQIQLQQLTITSSSSDDTSSSQSYDHSSSESTSETSSSVEVLQPSNTTVTTAVSPNGSNIQNTPSQVPDITTTPPQFIGPGPKIVREEDLLILKLFAD